MYFIFMNLLDRQNIYNSIRRFVFWEILENYSENEYYFIVLLLSYIQSTIYSSCDVNAYRINKKYS